MIWDQETYLELGLLAAMAATVATALAVLARQKSSSPGDVLRRLTEKKRKRENRRRP